MASSDGDEGEQEPQSPEVWLGIGGEYDGVEVDVDTLMPSTVKSLRKSMSGFSKPHNNKNAVPVVDIDMNGEDEDKDKDHESGTSSTTSSSTIYSSTTSSSTTSSSTSISKTTLDPTIRSTNITSVNSNISCGEVSNTPFLAVKGNNNKMAMTMPMTMTPSSSSAEKISSTNVNIVLNSTKRVLFSENYDDDDSLQRGDHFRDQRRTRPLRFTMTWTRVLFSITVIIVVALTVTVHLLRKNGAPALDVKPPQPLVKELSTSSSSPPLLPPLHVSNIEETFTTDFASTMDEDIPFDKLFEPDKTPLKTPSDTLESLSTQDSKISVDAGMTTLETEAVISDTEISTTQHYSVDNEGKENVLVSKLKAHIRLLKRFIDRIKGALIRFAKTIDRPY